MDRKQLFKHLAILIFLIFILNSLANTFYWYSSIWYFDMPMHFLGGLWLGLCFIYIFSPKELSEELSFGYLSKIIFLVLLIGIFWEFFELYFINHIAQNPFNALDTVSDIFFDLAGGTFAILYCFKQIVFKGGNEVK
jgi:hypothetical protein